MKSHLLNTLSKGIRYDGRKLLQYRDLSIELNPIRSAEGSARVKIGKTDVIAGVKLAIEKPYPDTPDKGNLMVNVELRPLSNPQFEVGPPGDQAVELARIIDKCIRESESIDTKKLCITKGEKVWSVMIDICPINDDGNLFDAAAFASVAALKTARLPKVEGETVDYLTKTKTPLPLNTEPISITVLKIGQHLLIDPLPEEEPHTDARLTVAFTEKGVICSLQKGGEMPLTSNEIKEMVKTAKQQSLFVREKFKGENNGK